MSSLVMLLHFYSPEIPLIYRFKVHNGHGLGSFFGKLFAKIAGKTAAKVAGKTALKAALTSAKSVGKSVLKTAVREATPLVKDGIKHGISEATKFGTETALQGINSLADKAKSKGISAPLVDKISRAVENKATTVAHQLAQSAENKINKRIDKIAGSKRKIPRKSSGKKKKKRGLDQSLLDAL